MIPRAAIPRPERARLHREIRSYLAGLRERARQESGGGPDPSRRREVIFLDPRKGHLDGSCVERLVFFLRGTGCSWVGRGGGCTFCGFWDATNFGRRLDDAEYLDQVERALADLGAAIERYPILCVYNDGSALDEAEMGLGATLAILRRLAALPSVRRLVIEAKLTDLREELLGPLLDAAGGRALEVAVGFESANPDVRDLCVNKSFGSAVFAAWADRLARRGVGLVPLVMVKPPFLTEAQAIHDVVETLAFLERFDLPRIDLEMATVERHTLVEDLWRHGLYRTPRLWSVLEIVRRSRARGLKTPLFISPPNYTVPSLDYTANCPSCTPAVVESIAAYNRALDPAAFDGQDCECRAPWARDIAEPPGAQGLEEQVRGTFDRLLAATRAPAAGAGP